MAKRNGLDFGNNLDDPLDPGIFKGFFSSCTHTQCWSCWVMAEVNTLRGSLSGMTCTVFQYNIYLPVSWINCYFKKGYISYYTFTDVGIL